MIAANVMGQLSPFIKCHSHESGNPGILWTDFLDSCFRRNDKRDGN